MVYTLADNNLSLLIQLIRLAVVSNSGQTSLKLIAWDLWSHEKFFLYLQI